MTLWLVSPFVSNIQVKANWINILSVITLEVSIAAFNLEAPSVYSLAESEEQQDLNSYFRKESRMFQVWDVMRL